MTYKSHLRDSDQLLNHVTQRNHFTFLGLVSLILNDEIILSNSSMKLLIHFTKSFCYFEVGILSFYSFQNHPLTKKKKKKKTYHQNDIQWAPSHYLAQIPHFTEGEAEAQRG